MKKFKIPINLGPIALKNLNKYLTKNMGDSTYGFKNDGDEYYLKKTKLDFKGDDIEVGEKTYAGTPGLWDLFTAKEPDKGLATEEDKKNYVEALVTTDKLLTVDKAGHVTIHSTASKKYIDVIKPIIDKKNNTKSIIRKTKKKDKSKIETKKWNEKVKKNWKK